MIKTSKKKLTYQALGQQEYIKKRIRTEYRYTPLLNASLQLVKKQFKVAYKISDRIAKNFHIKKVKNYEMTILRLCVLQSKLKKDGKYDHNQIVEKMFGFMSAQMPHFIQKLSERHIKEHKNASYQLIHSKVSQKNYHDLKVFKQVFILDDFESMSHELRNLYNYGEHNTYQKSYKNRVGKLMSIFSAFRFRDIDKLWELAFGEGNMDLNLSQLDQEQPMVQQDQQQQLDEQQQQKQLSIYSAPKMQQYGDDSIDQFLDLGGIQEKSENSLPYEQKGASCKYSLDFF